MLGSILYLASCTSDKLPNTTNITCNTTDAITYDNQIASIINASCAYSGCHDGASAAPDDYNSYSGLSSIINDGGFMSRVITLREDPSVGMPPNYAAAGPTDLTTAELQLIQCWIDAGYPEN